MANSTLADAIDSRNTNVKGMIRGLLDELPDDCSLEDIMFELYVRANIMESRAQIAAGKGISLDTARKELDIWLKSLSLPDSSPS
jgi:hypothetical protein